MLAWSLIAESRNRGIAVSSFTRYIFARYPPIQLRFFRFGTLRSAHYNNLHLNRRKSSRALLRRAARITNKYLSIDISTVAGEILLTDKRGPESWKPLIQ